LAKYLYSDLKNDDYKSLHHTKKLSILREIISVRLGFKADYVSLCSRILFYALEEQNISLLTIQKKRYLEDDYFFNKSASIRELRIVLAKLKKTRLRDSKQLQNKKHVKEGKKGVYVLLDPEYQNKLKMALNGSKITLTAMFQEFIDRKIQILEKGVK